MLLKTAHQCAIYKYDLYLYMSFPLLYEKIMFYYNNKCYQIKKITVLDFLKCY